MHHLDSGMCMSLSAYFLQLLFSRLYRASLLLPTVATLSDDNTQSGLYSQYLAHKRLNQASTPDILQIKGLNQVFILSTIVLFMIWWDLYYVYVVSGRNCYLNTGIHIRIHPFMHIYMWPCTYMCIYFIGFEWRFILCLCSKW